MNTPSTSDKERILKRLKKILALTKSSSPGEAAAALHQAQKLMQAYGLTESEVAMSDVTEATIDLTSCDVPRWENALLSVVNKALGVQAMVARQEPSMGFRRSKARIIFVGTGSRPELASYAYETLRRQLKRDLKAAMQVLLGEEIKRFRINPKWRENYALGWCSTLSGKIIALADPYPSDAAITAYIESRTKGSMSKPKSAPSPKGTAGSDETAAYFAHLGMKDGKKAQIHRAMSGNANEQQKLSGESTF